VRERGGTCDFGVERREDRVGLEGHIGLRAKECRGKLR